MTSEPGRVPQPTEELLAALVELWSGALERECGPDSDLFEMGGDSLTIVQMMGPISDLAGSPVSLGAILDAPTPRQLYTLLSAAETQKRL